MKYSLMINQKAILDNNIKIDAVDAMILDIIRDMPSYEKIEKKYIGNIVFFWVNHLNLASENPILGIKTSDGIYRRMIKMSELGLIIIHPENKKSRKSFYAISDFFNTIFIKNTSDEKPMKKINIGFETEVTSDLKPTNTSDEKPKDYSINKDYSISDDNSKLSYDNLGLFDSLDSINNNKDITNTIISESEKIENDLVERQKKCRKDMIEFFCKEYWPTYEFFGKRDGDAINKIIKATREHIEYKSGDSSPEGIFEFFKLVIKNLPLFYQSKHLAHIASSYSGIIKEIENGNKPRNNQQPSRHAGRAFEELKKHLSNNL